MEFEWITFLDAIALVFIIEGIMPFMWPDLYKNIMRLYSEQPSNTLRVIGFVLMVVGVILLYMVRYFVE